jgi:two-component system sensor histidine kinase CpxA
MQSLFLRIFMYFWGMVVLVGIISVALTLIRDQQYPPVIHRQLAQRAVVEYGREAANQYERHGREALRSFTRSLRREQGLTLLLFDAQAKPVLESRVACRMNNIVIQALQTDGVATPPHGRGNSLAASVRSDAGTRYVAAVWLPRRPAPQHLVAEFTRGFLGWQLLLVLGVTALVCFFLTRSVVTPIQRLRRATHAFASGNLGTRIGSAVRGRNEITALANDFDEMAARIEALVEGQQRLLRDISHELRSPLTRLGIALELARKHAGTPEQEKSLQRIELESERMNTMIGQLLDLTRMEHADTLKARTEVDLGALLEGIVEDAAYEAAERDIRVELKNVQPTAVHVVPELIAQAFENVIRNAVRYTPDGSRVEVEIYSATKEVHILVRDQGPGVAEAELEKLFIPFYRVAEARERHTGGTGIGLAIARRAVELHHGRIRASNRAGGGLEVEIVLPVK